MNCQELTELLDDGDIRSLSEAKRRGLDAHLSECADCAAEWRVQERIVMTPTPRASAGFVAQCRQLVAAGAARFGRGRVLLYGTLLVMAAAAAQLAWHWWDSPAGPVAVATVPVIAPQLQAAPMQIQPEAELTPEPVKPQPVAPAPGMFKVAVRPLQIEGNDLEGNAIAARFRERVMSILQGVPNLVLVDMQSDTDTAVADFEVRMKYTGSSARNLRRVDLEIQKPAEFAAEASMSPADQQRSKMQRQMAAINTRVPSMRGGNTNLTLLLGMGIPTTAIIDSTSSPPGDRVENAAQTLVRDLRIKVLPLDQTFEQEQLDTLKSPAQRPALRMRAFGALLSYAERRGGFAHASPAVISAGGEFALTWESESEFERPVIWDGLALTARPELVPYLIRGLNEARQTETRLQMVTILAEIYGDDPRARAALAAAAKSNDQQTVRMAAMRESGDSQWSTYVVATLGNSALSDLQRLQPIADMAPGDMGTLGTSPKTKLVLDEHQLRELGALIIRMAPDSSASETTRKALFAAGAMETPAALDMLIEIVNDIHIDDAPPGMGRVSIMGVRDTANNLISMRYAGHPKARAVITELARSGNGLEKLMAETQLKMMDMKASEEKSRQDLQPAQ